jgi:hypothetical protein
VAHLSAATARSHHEQPLPLVHPACRMRQHHRPPAASTPTPPGTMVAASCLISPLPASHLPLLALPNASALADATAPSRHPTVTTRPRQADILVATSTPRTPSPSQSRRVFYKSPTGCLPPPWAPPRGQRASGRVRRHFVLPKVKPVPQNPPTVGLVAGPQSCAPFCPGLNSRPE